MSALRSVTCYSQLIIKITKEQLLKRSSYARKLTNHLTNCRSCRYENYNGILTASSPQHRLQGTIPVFHQGWYLPTNLLQHPATKWTRNNFKERKRKKKEVKTKLQETKELQNYKTHVPSASGSGFRQCRQQVLQRVHHLQNHTTPEPKQKRKQSETSKVQVSLRL